MVAVLCAAGAVADFLAWALATLTFLTALVFVVVTLAVTGAVDGALDAALAAGACANATAPNEEMIKAAMIFFI